jgi:hypothetical protein
MPPGMVYDDLLSLCPPREVHRIYFLGGSTHRADSISPNDSMIMRMMARRGDLQFNVDSVPQW